MTPKPPLGPRPYWNHYVGGVVLGSGGGSTTGIRTSDE